MGFVDIKFCLLIQAPTASGYTISYDQREKRDLLYTQAEQVE